MKIVHKQYTLPTFTCKQTFHFPFWLRLPSKRYVRQRSSVTEDVTRLHLKVMNNSQSLLPTTYMINVKTSLPPKSGNDCALKLPALGWWMYLSIGVECTSECEIRFQFECDCRILNDLNCRKNNLTELRTKLKRIRYHPIICFRKTLLKWLRRNFYR